MTSIILKGFNADQFKILEFYKKRLIRIFPELLFLLVFFGAVIFFFLPTQFVQYANHSLSSSLFFSNIYYYLNSGYFEPSSHRNFLLHTWSLSVEWQFYLIFPLILLLIRQIYLRKKAVFNWIFLALLFSSFFYMVFSSKSDSSYAFYMSTTRGWEMFAGGLAFLYKEKLAKIPEFLKMILSIISYCIIAYFIINASSYKWPSEITLFPILATTVIIGVKCDFKLYKIKFLRYIGDLSYSLYLYHWPFYVMSMFLGLNLKLRDRLLFMLISVILAIASYHFIGKRNHQNKSLKILACAVIICCFSFAITKIDPNYYFKDLGNMVAAANYKDSEQMKQQYNMGTKHITGEMTISEYDFDLLSIPKNQKKNIVLLGDSHAGMFAETMQNIGKDLEVNIIQITADATYPMINSDGKYEVAKDLFNYTHQSFFPKNQQSIDLVVLSMNYLDHESTMLKKVQWSKDYFKKLKIPLLFIGQTNRFMNDFPTYYYVKENYDLESAYQNRYTLKNKQANSDLKNFIGDQYIDLSAEKIQRVSKQNFPFMHDTNHLTYYGTQQYKKLIQSRIQSELQYKNIYDQIPRPSEN